MTNFQKYTILLIALDKQKPSSVVLISVIFRIMWLKLSQNFLKTFGLVQFATKKCNKNLQLVQFWLVVRAFFDPAMHTN